MGGQGHGAKFLGWRDAAAKWSDESLLQRTDGFDFSSWWEDVAPQPPPQVTPKLKKVDVVRPKAKAAASPVMATCPKALLEALELMQREDDVELTPSRPEVKPPGEGRRSVWIGPRKVRRDLPAELAQLEVEESCRSATPAAAEVEEEALMTLADLGDSELGKICRGNVPEVQRELERQSAERATQRKQVYQEEAQKNRKRAIHFRRRVEKAAFLKMQAEVKSRTETSIIFERPRRAITTVSTRRLSVSVAMDGLQGESEGSQEESRREEHQELSERARELRRRIREATLAGIREKKKHADKMQRKRKYREAAWKSLPKEERAAIEAVFKLHCNKYGCLSQSAALDALRDIGLRGRTMAERNCVERTTATLIRDLMRVEEEGVHGTWGAAPEGEPQIWWRRPQELKPAEPPAKRTDSSLKMPAPRKRSITAARTSVSSHRSSKNSNSEALAAAKAVEAEEAAQAMATPRPTGVPLEAFAVEVMPAARWELFEQRTEPHFRVFVQEMETSRNPSGISYEQFQKLIEDLGLDKGKGALPPTVKRESSKIGPGTSLDLEMVHIRLLQLEERAAREASSREWAVAKLAKVSDWQFRMYRHELLWVYDMFTAHDDEHAGYLGRYEVRRLMKYMGLEPYSRHAAPEIERLIKEVDVNNDDEIELTEFLALLGHARRFQMKCRKAQLHRHWLKLELDLNGCLAYDQIVAALAQDGLLRTRQEYAIAQKLLDEEFDLSSVLRSSPKGESSPHSRVTPSSPRGTLSASVSPRRKQKLLLMADDPGSVDFHGYGVVYQRVWERLAALKGERVTQAAQALHFTMTELSDIQAAFDHYDRDHDGMLTSGELLQALQPLLHRPPEEQQLKKLMPSLNEEDEDDEETRVFIDVFEFMKLLRTLTGDKPLVHSNSPFSLANDVPFEKQQELLHVWPISDSYIQSLDASELLEMLSNFLGVKPEQNLRDLSYPISSFRKLREFALRKMEGAQQSSRF